LNALASILQQFNVQIPSKRLITKGGNMKIRRREFLKASAAVATVTALGCGTKLNALEKTDKTVSPYGKNKGEWVPTTCQGCTTWDPVQVYVQNGRAVKVRGNEYSKMNGGYCCARGHLGLQRFMTRTE